MTQHNQQDKIMLETYEKEINGSTWKTRELGGKIALKLALDIMQVAAPAMAEAAKGYDKTKGALQQEINVGAVINSLISNIDTPKAESIINRLLAETWKLEQAEHGTVEMLCRDKFDHLFAGKRLMTDLVPVLRFVFESNFGDFSGLASITGR
jgi:hypothetical protein